MVDKCENIEEKSEVVNNAEVKFEVVKITEKEDDGNDELWSPDGLWRRTTRSGRVLRQVRISEEAPTVHICANSHERMNDPRGSITELRRGTDDGSRSRVTQDAIRADSIPKPSDAGEEKWDTENINRCSNATPQVSMAEYMESMSGRSQRSGHNRVPDHLIIGNLSPLQYAHGALSPIDESGQQKNG